MPGFAVSIGDAIAIIDLVRKIVKGLDSSTGSATQYQRTVIELDGLKRVLLSAERLEADDEAEALFVNSIRMSASATALPLRDFYEKLEGYEKELGPRPLKGRISRGTKAVKWIDSMQKDVMELQSYLTAQVSSINMWLQLLARKTADRRAAERAADHTSVLAKLESQDKAINDLGQDIGRTAHDIKSAAMNLQTTMTTTTSRMSDYHRKNTSMMKSLIASNQKTLAAMVKVQRNLPRTPAVFTEEGIHLTDFLGYTRTLPYSFFDHWEVFESFLKHRFVDGVGKRQVQAGSFIISMSGLDNPIITRTNWKKAVSPGSKLLMAVILNMIQPEIGRCPKPSCGHRSPRSANPSDYVKCPNCGLIHRSSPVGVARSELPAEEEKLQKAQSSRDAGLFGSRCVPADVIEINSDDEYQWTHTRELDHREAPEPTHILNAENLATMDESLASSVSPVAENDPAKVSLSTIDWNSGVSGMEAWLNSSTGPMTENPPSDLDEDHSIIVERLKEELKDIEMIKRVHIATNISELPSRVKSRNEYQDMETPAQIYLRNIVDRFPTVPLFLAQRFAAANMAREKRLRLVRESSSI